MNTMITRHLGEFVQPMLICGGAYGNLEALEALAAFQAQNHIKDDHVIHTGDAVAYCADAELAAQFIASRNWHAIKGNVEEQIVTGADNCGCGFEEGSVCDAASQQWYAHALESLSNSSKEWMADLPAQIMFSVTGVNVRIVHGSVRQTNRFMFASLPDSEFNAELDHSQADLVIAGHTGIAFTKLIGNRCWHNSGALGMPANDATSRVWCSLLVPKDQAIELSHHALAYSHKITAAKIRDARLPNGYADGLETGLWPSVDILPDTERAVSGKPLGLDGVRHLFAAQLISAAQ